MSDSIPAPKNKFIEIVRIVLEKLIEGVGVDVAISTATAYAPWLGSPIIRTLFRWVVEKVASVIDQDLMKLLVKGITRVQSTARREEFNEAIKPIIEGSASDEEIQRARDAAIGVIERNRG